MSVLAQTPSPIRVAARAEAACVMEAFQMLVRRQIQQPQDHVGMRLRFADGTSAPVYRETTVPSLAASQPCVLVVRFRLVAVRGWGHRLFQAESLLNTPLFVGYPGFVSKLWLAHDQHGVYRGVYEWDGPERAEFYARSLWRVLSLVSAPSSIAYAVLPELRRDDVVRQPHLLEDIGPAELPAWARLVEAG